jgi:hypothetical protein
MGMIARRALLLTGAAVLTTKVAEAGLPVPSRGTLAFRVMRHGSQIGTHTLTFRNNGDTLEVDVVADVLVKFGPIPFVRYAHQAREYWRGDRLIGVSGRTNRNGKNLQMEAQWTAAGLAVDGSGTKRYIAPENALATTYWNSRMLLGPMIGTQDGMLVRPVVTQHATDPIRLASGAHIAARHCRLSGDLDLELWYDASDTWAGMRFTADDGSTITFERL